MITFNIDRFVRCADLKSSQTGLDISPAARFHQSTMYWQHPHLPWLTLFPRMSKSNNGHIIGEAERVALARDWTESFRALFQVSSSHSIPLAHSDSNEKFNLYSSWCDHFNAHFSMFAPIHLPSCFVRLALVVGSRHMPC